MVNKAHIKLGDTGTPFDATLTKDGSPVALAGATVKLNIRKQDAAASTAVQKTAQVLDPSAGTVRYIWNGDEITSTGLWLAEFVIITVGGTVTYPSNGQILLDVESPLVQPT
jgi:hypothetical protein